MNTKKNKKNCGWLYFKEKNIIWKELLVFVKVWLKGDKTDSLFSRENSNNFDNYFLSFTKHNTEVIIFTAVKNSTLKSFIKIQSFSVIIRKNKSKLH